MALPSGYDPYAQGPPSSRAPTPVFQPQAIQALTSAPAPSAANPGSAPFDGGPQLPAGTAFIGGRPVVVPGADPGLAQARTALQSAIEQAIAQAGQRQEMPEAPPERTGWREKLGRLAMAFLASNPGGARGLQLVQQNKQAATEERRHEEQLARQSHLDDRQAQALILQLQQAALAMRERQHNEEMIEIDGLGSIPRSAMSELIADSAKTQGQVDIKSKAPLTASETEGYRLEGERIKATNNSTSVMDASRRDAREATAAAQRADDARQAWDAALSRANDIVSYAAGKDGKYTPEDVTKLAKTLFDAMQTGASVPPAATTTGEDSPVAKALAAIGARAKDTQDRLDAARK